MIAKKSLEFRDLLLEYTKEIPNMDATGLIDKVEKLEAWVENYVDESVMAAVQPYVNLKMDRR